MTALPRRVKRILQRLGETYTCGATAASGLFSVITSSIASTYIAYADLDTLPRPIRMAYVPFDDASTEGATLTTGGKTFTVRRAMDVRFHGTTVARILVLA